MLVGRSYTQINGWMDGWMNGKKAQKLEAIWRLWLAVGGDNDDGDDYGFWIWWVMTMDGWMDENDVNMLE